MAIVRSISHFCRRRFDSQISKTLEYGIVRWNLSSGSPEARLGGGRRQLWSWQVSCLLQSSGDLVDPRALTRGKGGHNRRLGLGGIVGVVAILRVRGFGRAGIGGRHRGRLRDRGRRRDRRNAHCKRSLVGAPDCDGAKTKAL